MLLDGKRILITGSTSGIGRATVAMAAAEGATVIVSGRRSEEAGNVVAEIASAGGHAFAVVGDIAEPSFADRLVGDSIELLGGLDGVVNAAGIIVRATAENTTDEDWARQMAVNVDAVFRVSRAAVPHVRAAGGGSIVNVSSTCGNVGAAGLAGYCASKGAVISLTQAMALEHGADQIRVNAVCPGAIDTPMLGDGHGPGVTIDDVRDANLASIPQGRIPGPDEVADLIVFLLSDRSRHVTGADLAIDGGYTAQ
ncbi:MAG: SDR family NAD(P)-dependent oxidoreductase [Actinomycetota bacterium]